MAYTPTVWKDRVVENPHQYKDQADNVLVLTRDAGVVTEEGTPITADNMNKIETAIETIAVEVDFLEDKVLYNDKAIAELLMIADIDSKVFSKDLNKFYTDFTSTMDYSMGAVDSTKQLYTGTLSAGASSVTVTSSTGFLAGQEVSIQTATTYEDVIILSVVGNTINFKTNLTLTHVNPLIYRSNNFKQSFGGAEGKQLVPTGTVFGCHFNGNVTEFVGSLVAESNTGTFTTGLFGTQQIQYDGSQYTQFADGDYFNFGSGNFGIGFWLTRNVVGVFNYIFGQANSTSTSATTPIFAYFNANNTITFAVSNGSTNTTITTTATVADLLPHYYVITRVGNIMYYYLDGVQIGTVAFSGTLPNSANKFCIGRLGEVVTGYLQGKIEEFIIVKGQSLTPTIQAIEYATSVTPIIKNVIRMNVSPYQPVSEVSSFFTKSKLIGYTADVYSSIVDVVSDESFVGLTESVQDLGSTEEVTAVGLVATPQEKVTLKVVLNRATTGDVVTFTKLLGGVS